MAQLQGGTRHFNTGPALRQNHLDPGERARHQAGPSFYADFGKTPGLESRWRVVNSGSRGRLTLNLVSITPMIVFQMPAENYERVFDTFVRWARFGNLFAYNEDTEDMSLQ